MNAAPSALRIFRSHGGKIETARALFPQVRAPWIDLSTGISPWAYPFAPLSSEVFTRLPSPESLADLEAAAAASFGVADTAHVVAMPGSDLALRVLARVFAGRRVAVVRPGYSGHVLAWGKGACVSQIAVDEIERAALEHEVVVLANPNNPDGRWIERERLLAVAALLRQRGGTLVVDEAFADIAPERSLCGVLCDGAAEILVLRSFGKFYGLAGVRLGFVATAGSSSGRALGNASRAAIGDWPVSGVAIAIATEAYRDFSWQREHRARLASMAQRLDRLLTEAGTEIVGGTALFRLARCADGDALFQHLLSHGILTRPFTSDPQLVRFGLPGEEPEWSRLAQALTSWSLS